MDTDKKSNQAETLKEIAHISGKPGLFRILKPGRTGVIIESLDERKEKSIAPATAKVSILEDVSIYTDDDKESVPLGDVFRLIKKKHGKEVPLNTKEASDKEIIEFLAAVLPSFDRSRVYVSDIKKIASWYNLVAANSPDALKDDHLPDEEAEKAVAKLNETEVQKKAPKQNQPLPKPSGSVAPKAHTRRKV